jgi:hypothetical protein
MQLFGERQKVAFVESIRRSGAKRPDKNRSAAKSRCSKIPEPTFNRN